MRGRQDITEHLRCIEGAPSVAIQRVPERRKRIWRREKMVGVLEEVNGSEWD